MIREDTLDTRLVVKKRSYSDPPKNLNQLQIGRGKCLVQMAKPEQNTIIEADPINPSIGRVLLSGTYLKEGDEVLIDTWAVTTTNSFEDCEGEFALLGLANDMINDKDTTVCIPTDEQAPALVGEYIKPLGRQVLILRDPFQDSQNGILLPTRSQNRTGKATILEIGSKVTEWKQLDRVVYHGGALLWLDLTGDKELSASMCARYEIDQSRIKDLALIYEEHIYLGI